MTTTYDTRQQRQRNLVALDIDGTIATPATTEISDAVDHAIADARAAGHDVVLASGRSLVGVLRIARKLGLTEGWVVASDGAVTARLDPQSPGGCRLHDVRTFDPAPVVRRVRSAHPGARVATERVGKGYDVTHLFATHELNGEQVLVDVKKINEYRTTRLVLSASGIVGMLGKLTTLGVTVTPEGDNWLNITAPGLSKATALEAVRNQLGVSKDHTIAVGDGLNDLAMLAWAERGVAMGHAPAQVLTAADEVTGTLHENGAATVLRSLLPETIPAGRG